MTHPVMSHAKLVVIAHPGVSVGQMTSSKLKQIYLNRSKKWHDGQRIHLTILADHIATTTFIHDYLGKSNAQFNRYWKRQLFSGKGIPPEYFTTMQALLTYIQTTEGAIGVIDCDTPPAGVTIISLSD